LSLLLYSNPRARQEFEFIMEVMYSVWASKALPPEFIESLNALYMPNSKSQMQADLVERITGVCGLDASKSNGKSFCAIESQLIASHYPRFKRVRELLLKEFYPGKEGFDMVKHYWREQRQREKQ